jgi:hypothetical protein
MRGPAAVVLVREQDRVRRGETGGIWQFASRPATTRESRRGVRSLPPRTPSRLEYSGTRRETAGKRRADTLGSARWPTTWLHAPPARRGDRNRPEMSQLDMWCRRVTAVDPSRRHDVHEARDHGVHFGAQCAPGERIGARQGSKDDVLWRKSGQGSCTYDLTQSAFQPVSIDDLAPMLRDDEADSYARQRGSCDAKLEMSRPHTLPLTSHPFQIRRSRETLLPREPERLRRRRTCSAAALPAASAPSCDDGSTRRGPNDRPCGRGSRVCGYDACFGDGTWACPYVLQMRALRF